MVMLALLHREWLEHNRAFIYAPLVIVVLIVIAGLRFAPVMDVDLAIDIDAEDRQSMVLQGNSDAGEDGVSVFALINSLALDVAGSTDEELYGKLSAIMKFVAIPFYWVFLIMALFALVSMLYEERKDRSILFFKSMPIADWQTVLSKYAFVAWLAPIVTIGMILVSQLFLLTMLSFNAESGLGGRIWANSGVLDHLLQMIVGFALNGLVVLPVFGWFLLVSSWVKHVPFVLAAGIPFWIVVLEGILLDTGVVRSFIAYHASMPTLPRPMVEGELPDPDIRMMTLGDLFAVFTQGQFWTGVVIGLLFLAAAVYVRGVRNES